MKFLTRRRMLQDMAILTGASVFHGCATNPVTGRPELMLMGIDEEIRLGTRADREISETYGIYSDNEVGEYFNGLGQEMAKVTHRKNLSCTFRVLDSPVVNAFAVPGGFIYVTRGILAYFNNEAQLAGVLGHEFGHVNARHTAKRYSKAKLANLGLQIGVLFSEEFSRFADLAQLGTALLFLKFSRNDERQADQLGVEYSSKMAYDAVHMSDFFRTLEKMSGEGGSLPTWMSTHPDPGNRIVTVRRLALTYQEKYPDLVFKENREVYLDRINGITFGDDPQQGYTSDGFFYHPILRFMFPVPSGWKLTNTPSQVRMTNPDDTALMMFTLMPVEEPSSAADVFVESSRAVVQNRTMLLVNNLRAIRLISLIPSQGRTVSVQSYFIAMDSRVYVFHGLSASERFHQDTGVFETSMGGFSRLIDPKKIEVSPRHIEIREVKLSGTLEGVLSRFGVPTKNLAELVVLNGRELNDEIPKGTRLKLVD